MMDLFITPIVVIIFALGCVYFSMRIIRIRRKKRIALGDGGNKELQYAIRGQGNYLEYTVFFTFLLFFAEINAAHKGLLAVLSGIFLIGRGLHAYGFMTTKDHPHRLRGMILTGISFIGLIITNIWYLF